MPADPRPLAAAAYSARSIDCHYDTLLTLTRQVLAAGYPALVDATFLKRKHRSRFAALGDALSVPTIVLDFHARTCRLAERVRTREAKPDEASDAGLLVLVRQLANEDPLSPNEIACTVCFDTEVPLDAYGRVGYWTELLRHLDNRETESLNTATACEACK
jgi:predicted kinase